MNVNFQIGFVGVICLITEVATRIKCGSAIFFSVVFGFVMGRLSLQDNVIYLIITRREIQIIEKITEELSNKEISKSLFISEGTVKNYITSILQKTNLEHRTQIAIKYLNKI